ncbi:acyl-CoA dehydrogenase family protein [Nonomuraea sp. NPDC050451]|uniref:acyl-CoA dehydrogenase family protein n=1 Tax=Nonomuraea sp. NPDC050451 TaxID=3364364 RepID=UPI0037A9D4C3
MTDQGVIAWRRLMRDDICRTAPLSDIEDHLARPSTTAALDEVERCGTYPRAVIRDLRARGLAELFMPDRANCLELNTLDALTARRSGSLAVSIGSTTLALLPVYLSGSDEQCGLVARRVGAGASAAMLLTELDHGSNLLRNRAAARRGDGGFTLEGEKHLINGGSEHDLLMAFLRTRPGPPSEQRLAGLRDFSLFLLERDATVEPLPRWRTMPVRAADISGVRFRDTWAADDAVVGRLGDGFAIVQKSLMLSHGGVAAFASGAVSGALEFALGHARTRDVYGGPIVSLGAIAEHLVRMMVLDVVIAALAVKAAYGSNRFGSGAGYFGAAAKYACCRLAEEAVGEGRQVLGARAFLESLPYARFVRDVPLYGVFDGTSHVMLDELSAQVMRFATTARVHPSMEALRSVYLAEPQPIRATRRSWRPYAPALAGRCGDLASESGSAPVEVLAGLAVALDGVTRAARATGRWAAEQGLRFELAAVLAEIEALLAVCELASPACRASLGLPDGVTETDAAIPGVAVEWLGGRLADRLRGISRAVGSPEAEKAVGVLCPYQAPGQDKALLRAAVTGTD